VIVDKVRNSMHFITEQHVIMKYNPTNQWRQRKSTYVA